MKNRKASGNIIARSIGQPAWNHVSPARMTMSDARLTNASAPTWPSTRLAIPKRIGARPHQLGRNSVARIDARRWYTRYALKSGTRKPCE